MQLEDHLSGNFRFVPDSATFCVGVVAMPGYAIAQVVLRELIPYRAGFNLIAAHLEAIGRPMVALCGIELRVTQPLSLPAFAALNNTYVELLRSYGLLVGELSPIARTNVAPAFNPPAEPALYAFSYTIPQPVSAARQNFILSGIGDLLVDDASGEASIVQEGDTSAAGMQAKAAYVLRLVEPLLRAFAVSIQDINQLCLYTIHEAHAIIRDQLLPLIGPVAQYGLHWHYSRPPIRGVEFEIDLRSIAATTML
jgi:hypothetical protein